MHFVKKFGRYDKFFAKSWENLPVVGVSTVSDITAVLGVAVVACTTLLLLACKLMSVFLMLLAFLLMLASL
jgi:hypothetical protein